MLPLDFDVLLFNFLKGLVPLPGRGKFICRSIGINTQISKPLNL